MSSTRSNTRTEACFCWGFFFCAGGQKKNVNSVFLAIQIIGPNSVCYSFWFSFFLFIIYEWTCMYEFLTTGLGYQDMNVKFIYDPIFIVRFVRNAIKCLSGFPHLHWIPLYFTSISILSEDYSNLRFFFFFLISRRSNPFVISQRFRTFKHNPYFTDVSLLLNQFDGVFGLPQNLRLRLRFRARQSRPRKILPAKIKC